MKKISKVFVSMLIASVMAVGISTSAFAEEASGITVNGTGTVLVNPDTAVISASVESTESTAEKAKEINNKLCAELKNAMISAGISEDKIITEYTYVSPKMKYDDTAEEIGRAHV